jgi:hypothetical protein
MLMGVYRRNVRDTPMDTLKSVLEQVIAGYTGYAGEPAPEPAL